MRKRGVSVDFAQLLHRAGGAPGRTFWQVEAPAVRGAKVLSRTALTPHMVLVSIELPDGSVMTLAAGSEIKVLHTMAAPSDLRDGHL